MSTPAAKASRAASQRRYYEKNMDSIRVKNKERARKKRLEARMAREKAQTHMEADASSQVSTPEGDTRPLPPQFDPLAALMEDFWRLPAAPDLRRIMEVLEGERDAPKGILALPPDTLEPCFSDCPGGQYERYLELQEEVMKWTSYWGGPTLLADAMEVVFLQALETEEHSPSGQLKELVERVWLHEIKGRQLLRSLQQLECYLPGNSEDAIAIIWAYQQELVIMVVQCLTILQVKLPVMRRRAKLALACTDSTTMTLVHMVAEKIMQTPDDDEIDEGSDEEDSHCDDK